MTNKLVPDINVAIGAAIAALVELRPNALKHINYGEGRYSHLFEGWKAQGMLVTSRFADEVKACRLFTSGTPLQQLAASEFGAVLPTDPTYATGEVVLSRTTGTFPAGVIRKGHPFFKKADPDAQPLAIKGATYKASADVVVPKLSGTITVPIIADVAGPNGNSPSDKKVTTTTLDPFIPANFTSINVTPNTFIQPAQPLFDTNFVVSDSHAAGGTSSPNADRLIRRLATALSQGRFGPTTGAILAGALFYSGVANVGIIENEYNARTCIFPTDESWAFSTTLNNAIGQFIRTNYAGFGCSIQLGQTANQFIHVDLTVQLFETNDLIDPSSITTNIQNALTSYFNDRPDWWTWKTNTIKATVTMSDKRIFACTNAVVKDAVTGSVLSEPGPPDFITGSVQVSGSLPVVSYDGVPILQHYYLTDNACNITYLGPS